MLDKNYLMAILEFNADLHARIQRRKRNNKISYEKIIQIAFYFIDEKRSDYLKKVFDDLSIKYYSGIDLRAENHVYIIQLRDLNSQFKLFEFLRGIEKRIKEKELLWFYALMQDKLNNDLKGFEEDLKYFYNEKIFKRKDIKGVKE
jgi:hypothetical protein